MWLNKFLSKFRGHSPEDYQDILDIISDGMVVHFAVLDSDLNIVAINEAWGLHGQERGISLNYSWLGRSYVSPIEKSAKAGDLDAQLALNRLQNLRDGKINSFSFVYPCNDESRNRWFRCNARRQERNGEERFLICHIDITEEVDKRKALEDENQALASDKKMVQSVEEQMHFGLWSWSPDQQYLNLSHAACRILGEKNLTWHDLADGLSSDQRQRFLDCLDRTITKKSGFQFESEFVMRCGDKRYLTISGFHNESADHADGIMYGMVRDISLEKATEKRLAHMQKIEILGNLTAEISHDFNNSLSVIRGNTEMLREFSDAKLLRFINRIERATSQASSLTDKLARFARHEQEAVETVCVVERMQDVIEMATKLGGDEIEICFSSSVKSVKIDVDPYDFDNAILNLIINARDAMPNGGRLSIDISPMAGTQQAQQVVLISMEDTGVGISQEELGLVCEPFYSTKPKGKGTGLGLSVVSSFMEIAQGRMQISSKLNVGTKVLLSFPISQNTQRLTQKNEPATQPENQISTTATVLVVEDEEDVRSMVVEALKRMGFKVLEAPGSARAKEIVETGEHIDLLFTDVVLGPDDLGPDLADWFMQERPGIPILFTSGYADESLKERGLEELNSRILNKPYSLDTLVRSVKASLNHTVPAKNYISAPISGHMGSVLASR